jgi:hypothetical protein
VENVITQGLSDWAVGRVTDELINGYPGTDYIEYAEFRVHVEYNTLDPSNEPSWETREARDYNRVVLVVYAQDEIGNWHIEPGMVDAEGNVKVWETIQGNSKYLTPPLEMDANAYFSEEEKIKRVVLNFVPLKPEQKTVPLDPTNAEFGLPR